LEFHLKYSLSFH